MHRQGTDPEAPSPAEPSLAETMRLLDPLGYGAHYAELAGNLRSLAGPPRSVVVTGAGEGVGCSSVCLGLGGALAGMGLRAAVLDCDLQRPRLHKMLGEPNFTGLTTALESDAEPAECGHEPVPGLLVLPTGPIPESPVQSLEDMGLTRMVGGLREVHDVVLLDAPSYGGVRSSPVLSGGFDGVLLVVHSTRTGRKAAREAAESLEEAGAELLGVVLNGHP
ncbi:CpsD/CapB family tyrosine-protein kinase [Rubrobacter aplysinae]|uniref:CpsD/CapB family tyrosine-protein kinase n=1 Tax=Rubrobacter aplysinae TaxID=909625 RepID=UPI00069F50CB|nr:CpsD/CapB family tyrosine-protein kinase [Rubrobacter aplysinae]